MNNNTRKKATVAFQSHARPRTQHTKIALFVGTDVTSHLITSRLIHGLVEEGFKLDIFFPAHNPSKKPEAKNPNVKDFVLFERWLCANIVEPYVEDHSSPALKKNGKRNKTGYTVNQMAQLYPGKVNIEKINNINDPAFVKRIAEDDDLFGGVSIRCYQILKAPLINAFKQKHDGKGFIWNAHPGPLPWYRGVFCPLRVMTEGRAKFGWTLHVIDEGIDTGPLIDLTLKPIDYRDSSISLYTGFVTEVSAMILSTINKRDTWGSLDGTIPKGQDEKEARYFSYPSDEEWEQWNKMTVGPISSGPQGGQKFPLKIIEPLEMISFYANSYALTETDRLELMEMLDEVSSIWFESGRNFDALPRYESAHHKLVLPPGLENTF